jgi:8-amino-7-oxononanoate synthase
MLFNPPDHPAAETFDMEARLEVLDALDATQTLDPITQMDARTRVAPDPGGEPPEFSNDKKLVLSSNNFLGLATDDRVQTAAKLAIEECGTGAGGSRVAIGDTAVHRRLEREIAATKQTERSLVFSSGYATNVGTISALYPNVIFSDELNHTSLIEGSRITDAEIVSYDHCDPDDLAAKMSERAETESTEKWLVVTDSVFSMDGTVSPIERLCEVADEYDAWMMVDEAHATGVYGENGGGVVEERGLEDRVEIQMGTLSKALASQGGYVAGDADLIKYLKNSARSFLFSTGLNPPAAAAARKALEIARETDRAQALHENASYLRAHLEEMGFETWGSAHIVPIIVGDPQVTQQFGRMMRARDVLVHPVPYPAVPAGTSRIRVIPMATHETADIDAALTAFEEVGTELALI